MKQRTLARSCHFEGLGLHTGAPVTVTVQSAPADFGLCFVRTDAARRPVYVNTFTAVSSDRCTALHENDVDIITPEHLLSALAGLGIDNAAISINAPEVPILDGSSEEFVKAFLDAGIKELPDDKEYLTIDEPFEYECESGAKYRFEPSDRLEIDVEVDYPSKVVGCQKAHYDEDTDYASQIAPCRTFCFFNELEPLVKKGLIKGGSLDNALVIVDEEPSDETLGRLRDIFGMPDLKRAPEGYLSNCSPKFDNEVARHKLLDLIGDLTLAAMPLKVKITAYKPGHKSNAEAIDALVAMAYSGLGEEDNDDE